MGTRLGGGQLDSCCGLSRIGILGIHMHQTIPYTYIYIYIYATRLMLVLYTLLSISIY